MGKHTLMRDPSYRERLREKAVWARADGRGPVIGPSVLAAMLDYIDALEAAARVVTATVDDAGSCALCGAARGIEKPHAPTCPVGVLAALLWRTGDDASIAYAPGATLPLAVCAAMLEALEEEATMPETTTWTPCPRCEGCGRIGSDDDGAPWTVWQNLPPGADIAVRLGLVRPLPCPACGGTGGNLHVTKREAADASR